MKKLWLFDFDGVLADSMVDFESSMTTALKKLGYDFIKSRDDFLNLFHGNLYTSLTGKGVLPSDYIKCFEYVEELVDFSLIRLFNDIASVVREIKMTGYVGVVSSNRKDQIELILAHNNAGDLFPLILGFEAAKSKVDKINMSVEHFGVAKENTFYLLDTVGDIEEAHLAGVNSVAVGWGWHEKDRLLKHHPHHFVETPATLAKLCRDVS